MQKGTTLGYDTLCVTSQKSEAHYKKTQFYFISLHNKSLQSLAYSLTEFGAYTRLLPTQGHVSKLNAQAHGFNRESVFDRLVLEFIHTCSINGCYNQA